MPAIQMNGLVVSMANLAASIYLRVARHAAPGHTARFGIGRDEPFVRSRMDSCGILTAHHHRHATAPHHLFADMRFASTAATKRLVAMNHGAFFVHAVLRYKEPLALTDCLAALDFCGSQARNRCPYVVNTLTRHGSSE